MFRFFLNQECRFFEDFKLQPTVTRAYVLFCNLDRTQPTLSDSSVRAKIDSELKRKNS